MCIQLEAGLKSISDFITQYNSPLSFLAGAIFTRLITLLDKITERKDKNYNTLVKLQGYFNDCHNTASSNLCILYKIKGIIQKASEVINKNEIIRINSYSRFELFEINSDLLSGLTSLDYINQIGSYNSHLRLANSDMESFNRLFEKIKDEMDLVTRQIEESGKPSEIYLESLKMNLNGALQILQAFEDFFENYGKKQAIKLKAIAILLSKKRQTIPSRIIMFFAQDTKLKSLEKEIKETEENVKRDLEKEFMENIKKNAEIFNKEVDNPLS